VLRGRSRPEETGKALRLVLSAASGACSVRRSFTLLSGGSCCWHGLFRTQQERPPAFAALGFRERTVNPSTPGAAACRGAGESRGCGQRGVTLYILELIQSLR